MQSVDWKNAAEVLDNCKTVVLTTHVSPDGDGIGSEVAMYHFLKERGKTVHIYNPSPLPSEYKFLDSGDIIEEYSPDFRSVVENSDAFVILDIGAYARLRDIGGVIQKSPGTKICIDHHPAKGKNHFDLEYIDIHAAATGMMIYDLIKFMDPDGLNFEIAQGLYCALMTDTGSFRFSNTTPHAHEMAKELLEYGVEPYKVFEHVYESYSIERIKLLGKIIDNLHFTDDQKIAYFPVSLEMQDAVGAETSDVEGFTDFVRSVGGIEVAVMFHEVAPERTRINFRSKGRVVINTVAKQFGGGGHKFAAGAVIELPYEQAIPKVVEAVQEAVDSYEEVENELVEEGNQA